MYGVIYVLDHRENGGELINSLTMITFQKEPSIPHEQCEQTYQ